MRVDIVDREALKSVASSDMLAYLRILGWTQGYLDADRLAVYHKQVGDDLAEALVPLRPELPDYESAVHSLLRTIAESVGASQLQVFTDIQNVNSDIVRVRVDHTSFGDGSIPLEAGSKLVERAVDLLVAGACAADNPRAVYASRRSNQVVEYLREARLGQTERGSYIVTMKTIIPPTLVESDGQSTAPMDDYDEPFERKVTRTLANSLRVTRSALTEATASGKFDPFVVAVEQGVSANLLESIIGLISETGAAETEVALTWSPTRQLAEPPPGAARFSAQDKPTLDEASRKLRETSPRPEHKIEGFVRILQREDAKSPGTIFVRAVIDGRPRTVRMRLAPDEYQRAVQAHGDWRAIEVSGELVKQGNWFELRDPKDFKLYEADLGDDHPAEAGGAEDGDG